MHRIRSIATWVLAGAIATVGAAGAETRGEVPGSPEEIRPLLIGATVPDVELRDGKGEVTSLYAAMRKNPAVLIVYRGGW